MIKFAIAVLAVVGFMFTANAALADHDRSPFYLVILEADDTDVLTEATQVVDRMELENFQECMTVGQYASRQLELYTDFRGVALCFHIYDVPLDQMILNSIEELTPMFERDRPHV